MAVTCKDRHEMLSLPHRGIVLQHTFQQGQPPPSLSIQHGGHASRGIWSPVSRSSAGIPAWLNLKGMTTLYNYIKRGWNRLPTRRFVPVKFKKETLCPKKVLLFQPYSRGKWAPNYESSCAMTLTTMDGDKLTHPMNVGAVKKYSIQKIKAR